MASKPSAFAFLKQLADAFDSRLKSIQDLTADINQRWKTSPSLKPPEDRLACKENLFLYHHALPIVHAQLQQSCALSAADAAASLRGEYHAKFPTLMSGNAYRLAGHLFSKDLETAPKSVMEKWRSEGLIYQAYPDLGITAPAPFKIVCDAKYFEKGSVAEAEKALVKGIYELVFYRGLPHDTNDTSSGWNYEFGCLIAYDASETKTLKSVWNSLKHRHRFWDDSNVFVIVI